MVSFSVQSQAFSDVDWEKTEYVTVQMLATIENKSSWDENWKPKKDELVNLAIVIQSGDSKDTYTSSAEYYLLIDRKCKKTTSCNVMVNIYSDNFAAAFIDAGLRGNLTLEVINGCSLKKNICTFNGFTISNFELKGIIFK
jgi:hypothetical protein